MSDDITSRDASDICTDCGLCCSGALFDHGELTDAEVPDARALGLRIEDAGERTRFRQPCSALVANCCTIYAMRPGVCRSYRCQLLKRFELAEIDPEEAHRLTREARKLQARVEALLPADMDISAARAACMPGPDAEPHALSWRRAHPELTLAFILLNRMLDRHFRRSNQRMMADWDTATTDVD